MSLPEIIGPAMALDVNDRVILFSRLARSVYEENQARRPRVSPALDAAFKNFDSLRTAIGVCVSTQSMLPALMLIYAGMDIAGALNAPTEEYRASAAKFKAWTTQYVVPRIHNQATAEELYDARCGLIHAYTTASTSASPTANHRHINYVSYTPEKEMFMERLRQLTISGHPPDLNPFVILSVQELAVAYDAGWLQMVYEVVGDPVRQPLFERHCNEQFEHWSMPNLSTGA